MAGRRRARADGAPPPVLDAKAARLAAADLLSRRAWSQSDLTRRLIRRGAPQDVATAVVADLAGRGHVDDAAFARHFVETRAARGYGAARLAAGLYARGIPAPLVTAALGALNADAQFERALALGERRMATLRRTARDRAAVRLRDYLLRRGFGGAVVMRVVRRLTAATDYGMAAAPDL